jgi:hypothetical protein
MPHKNPRHELAKKEGSPLPDYNASSADSNHSVISKSSLDTLPESFHGEPGNTKKQKQMAVAELAFQHSKGSKLFKLLKLSFILLANFQE